MFKVDSAGIRKQLKWSRRSKRARTRTHISSSIANLTASWYFIKIKYSEPNISAAASVSPLAFAVLLLAVIKQRCIAAGAPFWIGGELPVFVVRHHTLNRDACTVTVRDEYMYRATPNIYIYIYIYNKWLIFIILKCPYYGFLRMSFHAVCNTALMNENILQVLNLKVHRV